MLDSDLATGAILAIGFTFGSLDDLAVASWSSIDPEKIVFNTAAENIVKKQMVVLAFFHSGIGPDRVNTSHKWRDWLHGLDFDNPNIPSQASKAFDGKMQSLVSGWSTQFKDQGVWTDKTVYSTSVVPRSSATERRIRASEGSKVRVMQWAIDEVNAPAWNGKFKVRIIILLPNYNANIGRTPAHFLWLKKCAPLSRCRRNQRVHGRREGNDYGARPA